MKSVVLALLISVISSLVWAAPGAGGGGGGDRPGYIAIAYARSKQCPKNEWRVKWRYEQGFKSEDFFTCEKKPVKLANYIYNPSNRCRVTGKAQPVMINDGSDRPKMVWEICKNGKYVRYNFE